VLSIVFALVETGLIVLAEKALEHGNLIRDVADWTCIFKRRARAVWYAGHANAPAGATGTATGPIDTGEHCAV
jgi:hypothetical protein